MARGGLGQPARMCAAAERLRAGDPLVEQVRLYTPWYETQLHDKIPQGRNAGQISPEGNRSGPSWILEEPRECAGATLGA